MILSTCKFKAILGNRQSELPFESWVSKSPLGMDLMGSSSAPKLARMQEKAKNPYFNKAHSNSTHLGQLIHHFKAMIDWLGKQLGEELVVEDLQAAATGDLADRGWVKTMLVVTVAALHKNTAVTDTFGINLPTDVVKVNTLKKRISMYYFSIVHNTLYASNSLFYWFGHTSPGSFQGLCFSVQVALLPLPNSIVLYDKIHKHHT